MANKALLQRFKKAKSKSLPKLSSTKKEVFPLVRDTELKWKSVEIPDTLEDYGGFYGLEEIDGVDVKVVNGQVLFVSKDGANLKGEAEDEEAEEQQEHDDEEQQEHDGKKQQEHGDKKQRKQGDKELLEFKNLDDVEEGELSQSEGDELKEEGLDKDINGVSEDEVDQGHSEGSAEEDQDELQSNVFNASVDVDDVAPPDLPEWTALGPLSVVSLHGLSKKGFIHPTEIQKKAIPVAMKGKDIMGKAATGSGKTLAYGIPILENLFKSHDSTSPIALIFTPTRELAQQVTIHLKVIGELIVKASPHCIIPLTGGLSIQKQERLLSYEGSGRVIVATPGRFLELIEKDASFLKKVANIKTLVLDEADRLLQDGHFDEFEKILKHLSVNRKGDKKSGWQTMIFSATFSIGLFSKLASSTWAKTKTMKGENSEMEIVLNHLMQKIHFNSKPVIIDTNSEQMISKQIKESLIECGPLERDLYSYYFVTMYPGTTLIFCNSIDSVKKLKAYLNNLEVPTFQIHSSMTQKGRLRSLEKYREQAKKNKLLGKSTVLIASDVAARGLDIPDIQHVIHYHLPRTADVYIHRSGRTARAEKEGVSVMICSPEEAQGPLRKLRKLLAVKTSNENEFSKRKRWQKTVPQLPIEPDIVKQLRERSRFAGELADHDLVSSSLKKEDDWLKRTADDLGIDVDSDDEERDVILAKSKFKKLSKTITKDRVKILRAELKRALRIPLRRDMRKKYLTGGLVNLADDMVKKRGHSTIIGQDKMDALDLLKNKKRKQEK